MVGYYYYYSHFSVGYTSSGHVMSLTPGFFLDAGHWFEFQFNSLTGLSSYARHDLMAFYSFGLKDYYYPLLYLCAITDIYIDTSMLV